MFGDPVANVDAATRAAVLNRDGHRCGYCDTIDAGAGGWHIDHILPVRVGGSSDPTNLTPACADCNQRKRGDVADFWLRLLVANGAPVPATTAEALRVTLFGS